MKVEEFHSGIVGPTGVWWTPADPKEKLWVTIAFGWCMVLFAMMPLWHYKGGQNPTGVRGRVEAAAYSARVDRFISDYQVKDAKGNPLEDGNSIVVAPPPGAEVYLEARQWQWRPVLRLKKGVSYTLHMSATDVNHGFSLYPVNLNFQVVPGYDYALKVTPNKSGDFRIICNEFCGIGHHVMVGKVTVED
jgi:cytochrome c oxidase subunit 2